MSLKVCFYRLCSTRGRFFLPIHLSKIARLDWIEGVCEHQISSLAADFYSDLDIDCDSAIQTHKLALIQQFFCSSHCVFRVVVVLVEGELHQCYMVFFSLYLACSIHPSGSAEEISPAVL